MRRVLLLFNPAAGKRRGERLRVIETMERALRGRGLDVRSVATAGPGTAAAQAAAACADGVDIVFACGGDGTVHEVIQGMAFQARAALGVVPLGSANALARHLGLSLDPVRAALQQVESPGRMIPLGMVTYQSGCGEASRYFVVMAGAGPDGALMYKMLGSGKGPLGRAMYYVRSVELFFRRRFSPFTVTTPAGYRRAVSAMAVRVADLGGLFSPLIRGADFEDAQLQLTTIAGPAGVSLPAWFALSWARLHRHNRYVRTDQVESFTCSVGESDAVQVQADGEHLGHTPMAVVLVPGALRLLMSSSQAAKRYTLFPSRSIHLQDGGKDES